MFVRVHYDKRVASVEPLGLEYIMAVVKQENRKCIIYDESLYSPFFRFKRLINTIERNNITFVGFSIISYTAWYALKLIRKLREAKPDIKIMVGGAEVTINYSDFMLDEIDYIYYDNGLDSLRNVVRNNFDLLALAKSSGIAYKLNGNWIANPKGEPINDYGVKPDRSIFYENRKKYKVLAKGCFSLMKGSFSCPQQCKFCISRQFNSCAYRERKIDQIIDEIIELDNDKIFFVDDDFLVNKERIKTICEKLIERKCYKTFMVFARADSIVRCEDIMPLLYKAGFRDMLVGLEAVDDTTLEKYNKNSSYAPNGIDFDNIKYHMRNLLKKKIRILIEGDSSLPCKNVDESFKIVEKLDKNKFEIWYLSYKGKPKYWYYVNKFFNKIPHEKVNQIYYECDILLKSSLLESFSYPPLEMMATGGYSIVVPNDIFKSYLSSFPVF